MKFNIGTSIPTKKEGLFLHGIQAGKIEAEAPESLPDGEYNTEKIGPRHTEKEFLLSPASNHACSRQCWVEKIMSILFSFISP